MPITRDVVPDFDLIMLPDSRQVMSGPECVACLDAARLSNREVARLLGFSTDHAVRNWTGQTRWYCPPPPSVQAWLRSLALAHREADMGNPPPDLSKAAAAS